jgi:hypothetical protein
LDRTTDVEKDLPSTYRQRTIDSTCTHNGMSTERGTTGHGAPGFARFVSVERVVRSGLNVRWAPNAPDAVLVSDDSGRTPLAVRPHADDADRRNVVLVWSGVESASLSAPNDEAISGHRLWRAGLSDVLWLGLVEGSILIAGLKKQNSVHPSHDPRRYEFLDHYIAPLKECVAEVVASSVVIHREDGSTLESAVAALAH